MVVVRNQEINKPGKLLFLFIQLNLSCLNLATCFENIVTLFKTSNFSTIIRLVYVKISLI